LCVQCTYRRMSKSSLSSPSTLCSSILQQVTSTRTITATLIQSLPHSQTPPKRLDTQEEKEWLDTSMEMEWFGGGRSCLWEPCVTHAVFRFIQHSGLSLRGPSLWPVSLPPSDALKTCTHLQELSDLRHKSGVIIFSQSLKHINSII